MMRSLLLSFLLLVSVSLMAQQEYAEPKAGEGISSFLIRNHRPGKANYNAFLELNAKRLRGKEELLLGVKYLLPPLNGEGTAAAADTGSVAASTVGRVVNEPLFGSALAQVTVTGNRLRGACFYVVSGHGGPDPGAIGKVDGHELHEDEYAYDVILRLARNLMQEGAEVHIIIQDAKDGIRDDRYLGNSKRETCMGSPIPLNQVARLKQRCDKINALYAGERNRYKYVRAIFLHLDSRSKREQTDVFFYHAPGSTQGKRSATVMRNTFRDNYKRHQPNRGFEGTVSERNLYVLRNAAPVSVFVELGNIQNSFDQRRFVLNSNRQALAKWLMEGFIADYNGAS